LSPKALPELALIRTGIGSGRGGTRRMPLPFTTRMLKEWRAWLRNGRVVTDTPIAIHKHCNKIAPQDQAPSVMKIMH
jgi:hypothetical protein